MTLVFIPPNTEISRVRVTRAIRDFHEEQEGVHFGPKDLGRLYDIAMSGRWTVPDHLHKEAFLALAEVDASTMLLHQA